MLSLGDWLLVRKMWRSKLFTPAAKKLFAKKHRKTNSWKRWQDTPDTLQRVLPPPSGGQQTGTFSHNLLVNGWTLFVQKHCTDSVITQKSADVFVGDLQRSEEHLSGFLFKTKIMHYSFLNGKNLKPAVLCEDTHSTRSHRLQCAHPRSVIRTHKVATQWGLSAPAQLHGFWLDVSLYLCRSPSPRLVMFSHSSLRGYRQMDGEEQRVAEETEIKKGEGGLHPLSFSSLNPN